MITTATAAKPMAVDDAPVGMQSLDVPFSVGPSIDAFAADDLPVTGAASAPPRPSERSAADDVALLEQLLTRVQANRRPAA